MDWIECEICQGILKLLPVVLLETVPNEEFV